MNPAGMRMRGLVVAVVAALTAGACGDEPSGGGGGGGGTALPPPSRAPEPPPPSAEPPPPSAEPPTVATATYQVPDTDCPRDWTGLVLTTDAEVEVEYLDDIPACTDPSGALTYLENRSDAVWTIGTTAVHSPAQTAVEWSFVQAVGHRRPGRAVLVPGATMIVEQSPGSFEWSIDLPLSLGFQGHEVVLEEIGRAGEHAAAAALARRSPAGAALAQCTLAVVQSAETVRDLADADAGDVVLTGLGVGSASSSCRSAAAAAGTVHGADRPVALAAEIDRLAAQTGRLDRIRTHAAYAQRAAKFLHLVRLVGPG